MSKYTKKVTVEQGFPGLLFWMILIITILNTGQRAYITAKKEKKSYVLFVMLSLITILINITLSDLIEADKIGTIFFLFAAIIVNIHLSLLFYTSLYLLQFSG